MSKFEDFRRQYDTFIYNSFETTLEEDGLLVVYDFEIPGLRSFKSKWRFPKTEQMESLLDSSLLHTMLFDLGMVETISYWKTVCPPSLKICCGQLTKEQIKWWKKLFYHGLGEFMYLNGIEVSMEDLVDIYCEQSAPALCGMESPWQDDTLYKGYLVPVGGGKDSVVSLDVLKGQRITTYSINGNATTKNVIEVCDYKEGDYAVKRILDAQILELNKEGYLNGHIPFSAVVAFSAVISAYLTGTRYIALSNESSANESTVKGSTVNHQYSKSLEFEKDFMWYFRQRTTSDITYFSLLRPLSEFQIAWLFAKCKEYHKVFRSCNAGSRQGIWCCNCPKCLFVYIILSPFLTEEELMDIFGEKLFDKESLDLYFRELAGMEDNKPFECVGTRKEVQVSLKTFAKRGGKSLLTDRYQDFIAGVTGTLEELLTEWVSDNGVPSDALALLKARMN
ncbi:MAG: hypothetical protein IJY10_03670 [Lachnospiraceae bacterium]|nr:hypothetical protein [Lachnospiraceae bacterium]